MWNNFNSWCNLVILLLFLLEQLVNNGTQTGFGRTGTVDWDTTPKTATFSAVSGNGLFCKYNRWSFYS